jgi:hypothetical protein
VGYGGKEIKRKNEAKAKNAENINVNEVEF